MTEINKYGGELLKESSLFDIYEEKDLGLDNRSLESFHLEEVRIFHLEV